jgi:hypothetical protein
LIDWVGVAEKEADTGRRATAGVTIVPKVYDLILWLVPRVGEFPRAQRFLLGDRIQETALDLLDVLVEAQYRRQKLMLLAEANVKLTRLRHLLRLANDLHLLGARRYEYVAQHLEEIGRMIGGWTKQQQTVRSATPPEKPA